MQAFEPQVFIEKRTFGEIEVSAAARLDRTLSRNGIELFAVMSRDFNPAHVLEKYARSDLFHTIIAHGMWGATLIFSSARNPVARQSVKQKVKGQVLP